MVLWHTFTNSIKLPQKKALFKLNQTGMDIVVFYVCILTFIASIPSFAEQMVNSENFFTKDMNILFLLIYFFMFYYLPFVIIVFLFISLAAYIGVGIAKLMQRKLKFSLLWKMIGFTLTIPFILFTCISIIVPLDVNFLWLSLLYTFILLIKMISIYPKRRKR